MAACIIIARFRAHEGASAAVEALLHGFVEPSRREDGCLFYDLQREVDDPNLFVILDGWRDKAAFEAHAAGAFVAETLGKLENLLVEPPVITELERLS